jgi:hypothetical protein
LRFRFQPHADMLRLHRLVNHLEQLPRELLQVGNIALAQGGGEGGERLLRVIAAAVEFASRISRSPSGRGLRETPQRDPQQQAIQQMRDQDVQHCAKFKGSSLAGQHPEHDDQPQHESIADSATQQW